MWAKAYNGRVRHYFLDEYRRGKRSPITGQPGVERKTLCGKWFSNYYFGDRNVYNHGVTKCKKCEEVSDG
jgi:hypothetical protein